jgi:hypothetical protein
MKSSLIYLWSLNACVWLQVATYSTYSVMGISALFCVRKTLKANETYPLELQERRLNIREFFGGAFYYWFSPSYRYEYEKSRSYFKPVNMMVVSIYTHTHTHTHTHTLQFDQHSSRSKIKFLTALHTKWMHNVGDIICSPVRLASHHALSAVHNW